MPLTELEAQQAVHIKELEARLASAESELSDYQKTVARLREELARAITRIKELQEVWQ